MTTTTTAPLISPEMWKAYRDEYGKSATDAQWRIFQDVCERRRAIPGRGGIYFQLHTAKEWDEDTRTSSRVKKATHISSIEFLQVLAERTGEYVGRRPTAYVYVGADGELIDRSRPYGKAGEKFFGAEVTVHRKDRPDTTVFARFDAYAATYRKDNVVRLNAMWEKFGPEQTAKCAFGAALRQAFPEDLGDLYAAEELDQAVAEGERLDKQSREEFTKEKDPIFVPIVAAPKATPGVTVESDSKPMPALAMPSGLEMAKMAADVAPLPEFKYNILTIDKSAEEAATIARNLLTSAETSIPATAGPTPEQLEAQAILAKIDPDKLAKAVGEEPSKPTDAQYADAVDQLGPDMAKDADVPMTNDQYLKFCDQLAKFANDVLTPGGIIPSKGLSVTAKVKKYILKSVGKKDLKMLTLGEFEKVLAVFNETAKGEGGPTKVVALIESKL